MSHSFVSDSRWTAFVVAACVSLVTMTASQGQDQVAPKKKVPPVWQKETLDAWNTKDSFFALAQMESSGPALTVAEHYGELAQAFYNDHKDLPKMIVTARAGIQYCLQKANELDATDKATAARFRGQAKSIAYNLGANCWPGWGEAGIAITTTDQAIGLDAARLNLRLGGELQRPPEPMGHAHWLLGAQLLAANNHAAAARQFRFSSLQFASANPTAEQMAVCYEQLAIKLQKPDDEQAAEAFKQALQKLKALDNDDARFFAEQIGVAEKVFAK